MSPHWLTVLAGLAAVVVLGTVGIHGTNLVERVSERALGEVRSTLEASGADWITAEADGLNFKLSGSAPSAEAYEAGLSAIAALRSSRAPRLTLEATIAPPPIAREPIGDEAQIKPAPTDDPKDAGVQREPAQPTIAAPSECPASVLNAVGAETYYFPEGSGVIADKDIKALRTLAEQLSKCPQFDMIVTGHSDASGDRDFNLALSQKRARAVAEILELSGISSNRLIIVGAGVDFPVASNRTTDGRRQNRRVTLKISSASSAGATPGNEGPAQ